MGKRTLLACYTRQDWPQIVKTRYDAMITLHHCNLSKLGMLSRIICVTDMSYLDIASLYLP